MVDKKELLERYKILGSNLVKNKKGLQIKYLRECMKMIEESFDPEFDGRHAIVIKLDEIEEKRINCQNKQEQSLYAEIINLIGACLALFQENK